MIEQSQPRIPVSVAAAVLIWLLTTAFPTGRMFTDLSSMIIGLIGYFLVLALAYGLWRRSGRARFWTSVFASASFAYGLVMFAAVDAMWLLHMVASALIVGLLLVPASSRRWFHDVR